MYAIVSQVVIPAMTSMRIAGAALRDLEEAVEAAALASAAGTLTTWSCLVSDTRAPSLGRAGRIDARGKARAG